MNLESFILYEFSSAWHQLLGCEAALLQGPLAAVSEALVSSPSSAFYERIGLSEASKRLWRACSVESGPATAGYFVRDGYKRVTPRHKRAPLQSPTCHEVLKIDLLSALHCLHCSQCPLNILNFEAGQPQIRLLHAARAQLSSCNICNHIFPLQIAWFFTYKAKRCIS